MSLAPKLFVNPSQLPKQAVVFIGARANEFINLLCDSQSASYQKELEFKQDIGKARLNHNDLLLKNGNARLADVQDANGLNSYLNNYKAIIFCPADLADLQRYTALVKEDKHKFYGIITADTALATSFPADFKVISLTPPESANEELRTKLLTQILNGLLELTPKQDQSRPDSTPSLKR